MAGPQGINWNKYRAALYRSTICRETRTGRFAGRWLFEEFSSAPARMPRDHELTCMTQGREGEVDSAEPRSRQETHLEPRLPAKPNHRHSPITEIREALLTTIKTFHRWMSQCYNIWLGKIICYLNHAQEPGCFSRKAIWPERLFSPIVGHAVPGLAG